MNLKKIITLAVMSTVCLMPSVSFASTAVHDVNNNRPDPIIVEARTIGSSPSAWYDQLPRIDTCSGQVNTSKTTKRFSPRSNIYVVSNCGASYTVALEQELDDLGWGPVQQSRSLPANVTNEVAFSDNGIDKSKDCIVRLSRVLPGFATDFSLTVFDASSNAINMDIIYKYSST